MSIEYHPSPLEILNIFDNIPKIWENSSVELAQFQKEHQVKLPDMYIEFMNSANDILETADIITKKPHFFFDEIEDSLKYLTEKELTSNFSDYLPFTQIVKGNWNELIDDYLVIGSDYGAGIVFFGIRKEDLNQENPPVYQRFETDSILDDWKLIWNHLSDYFLTVICDVLIETQYMTARETLRKNHWVYKAFTTKLQKDEILSKYEIELTSLPHIFSVWIQSSKDWVSCCYDKNQKILFLFRYIKNHKNIITVSKKISSNNK